MRDGDAVTARPTADLSANVGVAATGRGRAGAGTAQGRYPRLGGLGLRVWDLAARRERAKLTGHDGPVRSVAVTGDGTTAVSSGHDGWLRVWDLAARRERAKLPGGPGMSVAVSDDGTTAVSSSYDGSVRAWDLATGRERAKLTGHDGQLMSVAVSDDGTTAVSGDHDGSLRVWDLATGTQVARWDGDYPIFRCTALPGRPLKISIGQGGASRTCSVPRRTHHPAEQSHHLDHSAREPR